MRELISLQRYATFVLVAVLAIVCFIAGFWATWVFIPFLIFAALTALGFHDVRQTRHAVVRNYPVLGHISFYSKRSDLKSAST